MRIFDITKTRELAEPNLELGYLRDDTISIHHDAVDAIEEQGHWVTIAEYPNGGKDVKWVVDVAGVKGHGAFDETEDVLVYVPYTEAELQRKRDDAEIEELKKYLAGTDYICSKIVEASLEGSNLVELLKVEYAEELLERKRARARINELEG